jgi:hypothetical protein
MDKKSIIFAVLTMSVLMLITPTIPAVQNQVIKNSFCEKIIELIKNEQYNSLKELLIELIDDLEEPSVRVLHLRGLLNELDKYTDDNNESKPRFVFLRILLFVIGISLTIIGAFSMYFGSGISRTYGAIIALAGLVLIIISI